MENIKAAKRKQRRKQRSRAGKKNAKVKPTEDHVYFPHEIIVEILLRLPAKSLARFRCVCKSWNSLIDDPSFMDAHHRERAANKSIISKMDFRGNRRQSYMVKRDFDEGVSEEFPVAKRPVDEWCISNFANGLTCLCGQLASYLLNPLTWEVVMLPMSCLGDEYVVGLGFSTCTSEYKVVRKHGCTWEILTLGPNERIITKENDFDRIDPRSVFVHGALHWQFERHDDESNKSITSIILLNMDDEKFDLFPTPTACRGSVLELVELDEHLCLVAKIIRKGGLMEIWKMKDYVNRVWTKEYSINVLASKGYPMPQYPLATLGSRNGYIVFLFANGVLCYDPQKKTFESPRYRIDGECYLYTESLLSLKNWIK